jgi:hypothetical protein
MNKKMMNRVKYPFIYLIIFGIGLTLYACTAVTKSTIPVASLTSTSTLRVTSTTSLTTTSEPSTLSSSTPIALTTELVTHPQTTSTPFPALPASGQSYQLAKWTLEKAEQLIFDLNKYPGLLNDWENLRYSSYPFVGLAELESSARFPDSSQTQVWRWDGAYNLYRSGNRAISQLYAGLIEDSLNQIEINKKTMEALSDLKLSLALEYYQITPLPGYQESLILHFSSRDQYDFSGGITIWVLKTENEYYSYPLPTMWEIIYGNGFTKIDTIDISGNGIAEVFIQATDEQSFGYHEGDLKVYSLSQVPPQEISFNPQLPDADTAEWSVDMSLSVPTITFRIPVSTVSNWPCYSYKVDWLYQWQQKQLKLIQIDIPTDEILKKNPVCARILAHKLGSPEYLQNKSVLDTYKHILDLPFIGENPALGEYPFDVDKERLSLALYLSSQGDLVGANEQIDRIRSSTDRDGEVWRRNALKFFSVHQDPELLLQFCLSTKTCETFLTRSEIFALIPPNRILDVETLLQEMGIVYANSGNYDFDLDGNLEKWLLFISEYPCGNGTEFWLLASDANKITSRRVSSLCLREEQDQPREIKIKPFGESNGLPGYGLFVNGEDALHQPFLYWPLHLKNPSIDTNQVGVMIDSIQNQMLLGQMSQAEAQKRLHEIQLLPINSVYLPTNQQAQILYLLGLSQELNGENIQSAKTYLELWHTFPEHPYTMMAYAKLEPVP